MTSKNSKQTQEIEIPFDVDEMRDELGIPELEAEIDELKRTVATLQNSVGEWLVYMNLMDRRLQALSGEPEISETVTYVARSDGDVELQRHRPPIPASLMEAKPGPVKRTKK